MLNCAPTAVSKRTKRCRTQNTVTFPARFRQVPPGLAPDGPHDRLYHGVAQPQTASIRSGSSCFLGQRPIVSAGPHPAASSVHSTSMIDTSSVAPFVPADCDIDRRDSAVRAWKVTPVTAIPTTCLIIAAAYAFYVSKAQQVFIDGHKRTGLAFE